MGFAPWRSARRTNTAELSRRECVEVKSSPSISGATQDIMPSAYHGKEGTLNRKLYSLCDTSQMAGHSETIVANHARLAIPSAKWWAIPLYSLLQGPGSRAALRDVLLDLRTSRVRRSWGIFCPYLLTSRTLARGKSRSNALGDISENPSQMPPRFPAVGVLRSSLKDYSNGSNGLLAWAA